MRYLKTYENIVLPKLKKYVIWRSHPLSKIFHILEVFGIGADCVYAKFIYYYDDNTNMLDKNDDGHVVDFPYEEFLEENIIYQSNNIEELVNNIELIKMSLKYNI